MSNITTPVHSTNVSSSSQWSSPVGWAALSKCECPENPSQHSYCRNLSLRCTGSQRSRHGSRLPTWKENEQLTNYCNTVPLQISDVATVVNVVLVNLRPTEYVDGARGGFVLKQFNVRNGLRHLEGVLLLHALQLFFWLFKHHHQGVCQVLQKSKKMGYTKAPSVP